jgi:gamma-glutamyltranspeptidase/glutathione hydrolase
VLGIGSPGGDQQEQWSLAALLRHFHFPQYRQNLQAAIDAPLFHTTHYINSFYPRPFTPAKLLIETRFPAATIESLRDRGHAINEQDDWSLGRVCAAGYIGDMVRAAATPRFMQAYAIGR